MFFFVCHLSIKLRARGVVERGSGAMGLGGDARRTECAGRMGPALRTVAPRDMVCWSSKKYGRRVDMSMQPCQAKQKAQLM